MSTNGHEDIGVIESDNAMSMEEKVQQFQGVCKYLGSLSFEDAQVIVEMHESGKELLDKQSADQALDQARNESTERQNSDKTHEIKEPQEPPKKPKFVKKADYLAEKAKEGVIKEPDVLDKAVVKIGSDRPLFLDEELAKHDNYVEQPPSYKQPVQEQVETISKQVETETNTDQTNHEEAFLSEQPEKPQLEPTIEHLGANSFIPIEIIATSNSELENAQHYQQKQPIATVIEVNITEAQAEPALDTPSNFVEVVISNNENDQVDLAVEANDLPDQINFKSAKSSLYEMVGIQSIDESTQTTTINETVKGEAEEPNELQIRSVPEFIEPAFPLDNLEEVFTTIDDQDLLEGELELEIVAHNESDPLLVNMEIVDNETTEYTSEVQVTDGLESSIAEVDALQEVSLNELDNSPVGAIMEHEQPSNTATEIDHQEETREIAELFTVAHQQIETIEPQKIPEVEILLERVEVILSEAEVLSEAEISISEIEVSPEQTTEKLTEVFTELFEVLGIECSERQIQNIVQMVIERRDMFAKLSESSLRNKEPGTREVLTYVARSFANLKKLLEPLHNMIGRVVLAATKNLQLVQNPA